MFAVTKATTEMAGAPVFALVIWYEMDISMVLKFINQEPAAKLHLSC